MRCIVGTTNLDTEPRRDNAANVPEEHREITIFVNNQPLRTNAHELTGLEIKALAHLPTDYELFVVKGEQSVPVANGEKVHLHEGEHFRAIPAGTFGQGSSAACEAR